MRDKEDQDISKYEKSILNSKQAKKTEIIAQELRLVHIYKPELDKIIEIITNQTDGKARSIDHLYKKRWDT